MTMPRFSAIWRNGAWTPAGLAVRGVALGVCWGIAHLAGWRDYTSVLNGTTGPGGANWTGSVLLGVTYLLAYMGAVVLAPILLLASGILWMWLGKQRSKAE